MNQLKLARRESPHYIVYSTISFTDWRGIKARVLKVEKLSDSNGLGNVHCRDKHTV